MSLFHLFQSEVEETLKRIQSHRGVVGIMIVNNEGKIFGIYCSKWVITLTTQCYTQRFMDIRVNRILFMYPRCFISELFGYS